MSPEAWAFCGVLAAQVVTLIVGVLQTRRADNTAEIAALAKDVSAVQADVVTVKVDVVETKTEVKNLKGWVGSIDRRLSP